MFDYELTDGQEASRAPHACGEHFMPCAIEIVIAVLTTNAAGRPPPCAWR